MERCTVRAARVARFVLAGVCLLALAACTKNSVGGMAKATVMQNASAKLRASRAPMAEAVMDDMDMAVEMEVPAPASAAGNESGAKAGQERKIIYSGNLRLEVRNLGEAKEMVENWVKRYGGYISNSSESETSATITANIPSASFAPAMEECGTFGRLKSKNIYTDDVTERFYDLSTRLSTRKVLLERLRAYLATAKTMQELLQIETKINDVTAELERMQGQMNRLSTQIDFSQISVYLELPVNQNSSGGFVLPSIRTAAREFVGDVARFFVAFGFVALKVVVFGVPCVLFLMLLFWLSLGKVGLLRRLFARIRAEK